MEGAALDGLGVILVDGLEAAESATGMRPPLRLLTATALSFFEPITAPTPERAAIRPFSFTIPASSDCCSPAGPMHEIFQRPGSAQLLLERIVGLVGVLAPNLTRIDQAGPAHHR